MKTSKRLAGAVAAALAACMGAGVQATWAQGLEEVIVTAQKREEGLQDVPIAVEAFSAEQIDQLSARDISDVGIYTPNVDFSQAANQPRYAIRGIGTDDFGVGADPAVGVYQDGVYIGRSGGSKVAFNDIARVEILNGPQGTLFGRNAAAGAIQYVTNKPQDDQSGWVRATIGNYDRYQLDGVYNVPLTNKLFFRAGALWNERDGWIDNVTNGKNLATEGNRSINAQLRWLPSDVLDMNLRLEYDQVDQDSRVRSSAVWGPRDGDNGPGFTRVASDSDLKEQRDLFGAAFHLTYDMSWATLTSITAWRQYQTRNPEEKDGSAEPLYDFNDLNKENNQQFSQELRLNGDWGDRVIWTAGVNYSWEDAKQTSGISLSPVTLDKLIAEREIGLAYDNFELGQPTNIAFLVLPDPFNRRAYDSGAQAMAEADRFREKIFIDGTYQAYAAFADITFDITETLSFTAGARYTYDDKEFARYTEFNEFVIAFGFPTETRIDASGNYDENGELGWLESEDNWSKVTPRAVLEWQATDDIMLYASYSEGYKAGGFNSAGEILAPSFDPEDVTNYEAGLKSTWLDNTLRVNAAVFSYDYENLQSLEFIEGECLPGSNLGSYLFETSDVEGDGMELSANWLPVPELNLFANVGLLDASYVRRDQRTVVDGQCQVIDRSGEQFSEAPEFSYSIGGSYTFNLDSGGEVVLFAAYNFKEGLERNECTFVVDNSAQGQPSDVYRLTELDGQLVISDPSATGNISQPPFSQCPDGDDRKQLNARVTYFSPEQTWEVAAFVTNATDWEPENEDPGGLGSELASSFSDGSPSYGRTEEPRMYGIEVRYRFD
tara:strand:- start:223345 stop:225843 length:2499 start_codon:yes stop_codon:yes gene_type:complete